MKNQFFIFVVRWVLSSFGLWICVRLFGKIESEYTIGIFLLSGLVFSLVNTVVKPFVTLLSLPAILLTLGLFTLVVNGVMVYLAVDLTPGIEMGFWSAVLSGVVMSILNYVVNVALQSYNVRYESR